MNIIYKTDICFLCYHLTYGLIPWAEDALLCIKCSCQCLTPEAHYEETGIANPRYIKKYMTKLLKG